MQVSGIVARILKATHCFTVFDILFTLSWRHSELSLPVLSRGEAEHRGWEEEQWWFVSPRHADTHTHIHPHMHAHSKMEKLNITADDDDDDYDESYLCNYPPIASCSQQLPLCDGVCARVSTCVCVCVYHLASEHIRVFPGNTHRRTLRHSPARHFLALWTDRTAGGTKECGPISMASPF